MKKSRSINIAVFIGLIAIELSGCSGPIEQITEIPKSERAHSRESKEGNFKRGDTDESWSVVTAKFQKSLEEYPGSKRHSIRIADPQWQNVDLSWPEDTRLPLKEGHYYTFTILTLRFYEFAFKWSDHPVITKVVQDGMVLYDASLCSVHGSKMIRKRLPIVYGLIEGGYRGIPFSVWREHFPHGYLCWFGGCVMDDGSPSYRKSWLCPECVRQSTQWPGYAP